MRKNTILALPNIDLARLLHKKYSTQTFADEILEVSFAMMLSAHSVHNGLIKHVYQLQRGVRKCCNAFSTGVDWLNQAYTSVAKGRDNVS